MKIIIKYKQSAKTNWEQWDRYIYQSQNDDNNGFNIGEFIRKYMYINHNKRYAVNMHIINNNDDRNDLLIIVVGFNANAYVWRKHNEIYMILLIIIIGIYFWIKFMMDLIWRHKKNLGPLILVIV